MEEHDTFIKRTEWGALVLGVAGGLVLAVLGSWGWAAGFVLGSGVSLGNFHLIIRGVGKLVAAPSGARSGRVWSGAALRFLVAGAALVLAVVVLRVNVLALLAGLVITQLGMIGYWLWASLRTGTTPGA